MISKAGSNGGVTIEGTPAKENVKSLYTENISITGSSKVMELDGKGKVLKLLQGSDINLVDDAGGDTGNIRGQSGAWQTRDSAGNWVDRIRPEKDVDIAKILHPNAENSLEDDRKHYFGSDDDYSIYYDSTNDEYVVYDEVNSKKLLMLPKNNTITNILESGGVHELLHANMNIGASDHHAKTTSGDIDHALITNVLADQHHTKTGDNEVKGLVLVDTVANRPATGISGRWFIASDTLAISYDDGAAWTTVGTLGGEDVSDYSTHKATSDAHHTKTTQRVDASIPLLIEDTSANIPAAGTEGRIFFETDTGKIKYDNGTSWVVIGVSDHTQLSGVASDQHHTKYTDSEAISAAYADPVRTANTGKITLGDGETFEIWRATLPAGKQIKVIEAGINPSGVVGLTIEVYNHTDAVSIYSNNVSYDDGSYSTPLASGGAGDDVEIRINNASGATDDASGWVTFVVE